MGSKNVRLTPAQRTEYFRLGRPTSAEERGRLLLELGFPQTAQIEVLEYFIHESNPTGEGPLLKITHPDIENPNVSG